jgi:hypothetical protein
LDPESDNKALEEFAKPSERDAMRTAMGEAFEWLGDHAESADEATLRKKRTDIEYVPYLSISSVIWRCLGDRDLPISSVHN